MSESNLPLDLSQTTSIDNIWDFEIQAIENAKSLPLARANSDICGTPSVSTLNSAPSRLLTPTLGSNTANGSNSGGERRIYERRRKVRKSWVYHPENGVENVTSDGSNKRMATMFADTLTKNRIELLCESHKIGKTAPIQIQLEKGQIQIQISFGNTRPQIIFNQDLNRQTSEFSLNISQHVMQHIVKFNVHYHIRVILYDHG
ncbi:hypothetical protein HOY82DRAFT_600867 [Tuber indicum]|nr:hypothetical protein HOY82DRAFT_600867 [Tuber indicum]